MLIADFVLLMLQFYGQLMFTQLVSGLTPQVEPSCPKQIISPVQMLSLFGIHRKVFTDTGGNTVKKQSICYRMSFTRIVVEFAFWNT